MTTVGPSPPAASLSAAGEVGLVEPNDRVGAGLPRYLEPLGTAAGRDDPLGSLQARSLHRGEADGAGCPEDEDSVPGTDLRAPDNGQPAGKAGRPAGGCELVGDAVGKLERLLLGDRRELRKRPVPPAAAEPVVRDVHAGARLERVGLDDRPHAFRAGDVRRLRRPQVVLARGEGGIDRVQRNRVDPNESPSGAALGRIGFDDLGEPADLADERRLHRRSLTSPSG